MEMRLVFRACDDGVAFRYEFAGVSDEPRIMEEEKTGFKIPMNGRAWIHPYDWNSRLKPSYEQYCVSDMPVGTKSPQSKGWAFPMLFHADDLWIMVTQASLDRSYPPLHVDPVCEGGLYTFRFPEKEEVIYPDDDPRPVSTLPWRTPWRVIVIGDSPAAVVETQLVTHLNEPSRIKDESWIKPGRSSWSWWYEGGSPRNFSRQKEYIDFTAEMGWEYTLIDAGWPSIIHARRYD